MRFDYNDSYEPRASSYDRAKAKPPAVDCSRLGARSSLSPIKAQCRVSLCQLAIAPQFTKRFFRIESFLMLGDHQAALAQQFRLGESHQRLGVLVLHRVRRIQKDKVSGDPRRLKLRQGFPSIN